MPLAFVCPGSVRPPAVPISQDSAPAALGTAAHVALQHLATHGEIDWAGLDELAGRHAVSVEELRMLCAMAAKLWPSIKDSFAGAWAEIPLSATLPGGLALTGHMALTGHVDLMAISDDGKVARVGDWKTGRKDHDYSHQMRAYGALAMLDDIELETVTVTVIWVRDAEIENYTMTRADVREWIRELLDRVVSWDGVYHPGRHCPHCPRSHECDAANALARRDVAGFRDVDLAERAETELATMTPAAIVELYELAVRVGGYAGRVRDAIRLHVERSGEVAGNGYRLTVETSERRELDPVKAWPVLEAHGFADEDFAACIDIRISRAEKVAAQKAGRGKGAAAVRELAGKLEEAGAVSVRETKTLTQKRM